MRTDPRFRSHDDLDLDLLGMKAIVYSERGKFSVSAALTAEAAQPP